MYRHVGILLHFSFHYFLWMILFDGYRRRRRRHCRWLVLLLSLTYRDDVQRLSIYHDVLQIILTAQLRQQPLVFHARVCNLVTEQGKKLKLILVFLLTLFARLIIEIHVSQV